MGSSTSEAVTQGIRVSVECRYAPEYSQPQRNQWFFLYTIQIANEGEEQVQLLSRHWVIRDATGRYLITQRRSGSHLEGLWEFPGGKREPKESFEECLRRELTEELSATFRIGKLVEIVRWEYPDRRIVLHFYECHLESGTIEPREGQAMAWVEPARLADYDFPPADRALLDRLLA